MNDKRLGEKRFHEPASVKELRFSPVPEDIYQEQEGGIIEYGSNGTDEENKAVDIADGPLARPGDLLVIDPLFWWDDSLLEVEPISAGGGVAI